MSEDVPLLDDLMPWSVGGLRLGRDWVAAPDPAALRARWATLTGSEGAERERLFRPSRSRRPDAGAAALPGQRSAATARFADAPGPCPDPVRVLREPFDEQWLLPDQRLIDAARPELWRVRDEHQLFLALTPDPLVTAHLPVGRLGRIRPLHRRPGGAEPNLAPGLLPVLGARHGVRVTPRTSWAGSSLRAARARAGTRSRSPPIPSAGGPDWSWGTDCWACSCAARAAVSRPGCPAGAARTSARRSRAGRASSRTTPRARR